MNELPRRRNPGPRRCAPVAFLRFRERMQRQEMAAALQQRRPVNKRTGSGSVNRPRPGLRFLRIPLHPIRRSGRIRSLVPEDPIRDRSGATSGMMIRLQGWDRAGP